MARVNASMLVSAPIMVDEVENLVSRSIGRYVITPPNRKENERIPNVIPIKVFLCLNSSITCFEYFFMLVLFLLVFGSLRNFCTSSPTIIAVKNSRNGVVQDISARIPPIRGDSAVPRPSTVTFNPIM